MILKGENIILRPLKMSDAPRFVGWLSDSEVNKFTTRKKISLKEEQKWIKNIPKQKDNIKFAIDTKEGVHIGSAGFHFFKQDKNAYFDILIGDKKYWGKGYGSDVIKIMLDYGFKKLKLHRIFLDFYIYNKRANNLYKKMGFKVEGIQRENSLYNGKFYDKIWMGILKREWDIFKNK